MEKCVYCNKTLLNQPSKVRSYVILVELCPSLRGLPEETYDHLMRADNTKWRDF